jgi:hypothetical protein
MSTEVHDLVLIHIEGKPAVFARIEAIDPDVKPGWWRVRLLILTVPLQTIVWILEREQIDGKPFTMGGTPIQLEKVVPPESNQESPPEGDDKGDRGNVISLADRRRRR